MMSRLRAEAESACRRGRCKVYYYHVHKAGGTTLCAMAGANNMKIKLGTNCLEKENGGALVKFW